MGALINMSKAVPAFIHEEILRARAITDRLFAQVLPDALYERPIPERHRLIFYVGHLEAFDWNLIGKSFLGLNPIDPALDSVFAFGIDPTPGALPQDKATDWPELFQVRRYVARIRSSLDTTVNQANEHVLRMALEHRLMHAETLTYLIHNLPYSKRLTRMRGAHSSAGASGHEFITIPAGSVSLGLKRGEGFGWDNEFEFHQRDVEGFSITKYKVTNGQYLQFVRDGGPVPHYWIERGDEFRYRGFHGEVPLPTDFPVFVSYVQAEAYAKWMNKAVPTESQFHRAAFGTDSQFERPYPWGQDSPRQEVGNFDFSSFEPLPVTSHPAGNSAFGVSQMMGNGWEWTSSEFAPFPGFRREPLYPGYSADFFDGDHHVVKGASCATDHLLMRRSFRNWFRVSYPYAYTSFRLVEN